MLLTDAIIEHHAITQLFLALVVLVLLQLEELERRLRAVLLQQVLSVPLVSQRHNLCCIPCYNRHSLSLVHSMAGMSHSSVLVRCMPRMSHSLVLVCCMPDMSRHSDSEQHDGGTGDEIHNDWWFCIVPADSDCFGQLQRCWRAALRPTRTGFLDVALLLSLINQLDAAHISVRQPPQILPGHASRLRKPLLSPEYPILTDRNLSNN